MRKNFIIFFIFVSFIGCSTHQKVVKVEPQIQEIKKEEKGLKRKVAITRFSNETQYAKGIFYDKDNDPISKQALDILSTKLASTNKFILMETQNMDEILDKLNVNLKITSNDSDNQNLTNTLKNLQNAKNEWSQSKINADYIIIGSVTEFGRKTVGDVNAFSRSKTQVVQAGVSIRLVDVSTGQIIYSEEAKGEAETTNKTVMGLGEHADYDATLSDKAISVAISKLVENIINNCMDRPWKSYFISYDDNGILISGGKSQGLKIGDIYEVVEKGKSIKNPQTGLTMELPGKSVGKIKIDFIGGDNSNNEYSTVSFKEGSINKQNLENYYVKEIK